MHWSINLFYSKKLWNCIGENKHLELSVLNQAVVYVIFFIKYIYNQQFVCELSVKLYIICRGNFFKPKLRD